MLVLTVVIQVVFMLLILQGSRVGGIVLPVASGVFTGKFGVRSVHSRSQSDDTLDGLKAVTEDDEREFGA